MIPTTARPSNGTLPVNAVARLVRGVIGVPGHIPDALVQLFARLAIAPVFWLSGQTKVDGWTLKDTTVYLFRHEYQVPVLPPELAATMATAMEHALPILLVIGLATRLAALGLLGMTLVIQLFVYPDAWSLHALWAALLLVILARGPGAWSLDHLIGRRLGLPQNQKAPWRRKDPVARDGKDEPAPDVGIS